MTEYKCGNCAEVFVLSPKAKFCPECGSSSLKMVIKELKEPSQKETIGVYSPTATPAELGLSPDELSLAPGLEIKDEEDRPRRPRRR